MFRSQYIQVFVFSIIPYLANLRRHDEYWYMRQGAFLNIFFQSQLFNSFMMEAVIIYDNGLHHERVK